MYKGTLLKSWDIFFPRARKVVIKFIWKNKFSQISEKILKIEIKEKEQRMVEGRPFEIVKYIL